MIVAGEKGDVAREGELLEMFKQSDSFYQRKVERNRDVPTDEDYKKEQVADYHYNKELFQKQSSRYLESKREGKPMDDDTFMAYLKDLLEVDKAAMADKEWQPRFKAAEAAKAKAINEAQPGDADRVETEETAKLRELKKERFVLSPASDRYRLDEQQQTMVLDKLRDELQESQRAGTLHLSDDIMAQLDQKHKSEQLPTGMSHTRGQDVAAGKFKPIPLP
jgi:hypothetical protein